jgi:molecular chaperone GrpE
MQDRFPDGETMKRRSDEEEQPRTGILPEACPSGEASGPPADEGEQDRLRAEIAALQDRLLRLQAEFENYRKRQQRDREEIHRQARERVLGELPGVVDNLERALRHAGAAGAAPETLAQGVELVCKQLQEVLTRFGAEPIAALGSVFDPRLHEAMAMVETAGDPADGTVVEEYRRGYLLDGKVLRPALVAVAKLADEEGEPVS